jgi:hypothetical protein
MPTFFTDPAPGFYLVLLAFTVVTGAMAARNQDRRSFVRFAIAAAILLAVYGVDKAFESPREQAVRRVQAMARAADEQNPDAFVAHIADTIEYRGSSQATVLKREDVRRSAFWPMLRRFDPRVVVWDFSRDDVKQIDDNTIEIGFSAKGELRDGTPFPLYMRAAFKKQPNGEWKLTAFASYEFAKHDVPFAIPGMGN